MPVDELYEENIAVLSFPCIYDAVDLIALGTTQAAKLLIVKVLYTPGKYDVTFIFLAAAVL